MIKIEHIIPQPNKPSDDQFNLKVDKDGVYIVSEEAGTLWIWAFEDLISWPIDLVWLFPKVSSDGVGDLWGIDATGDLIIVETKRSTRKKRLQDPFEDFLKDDLWAQIEFISPKALFEKWEALQHKEIEWIESGFQRPKGSFPGTVPYSYHRSSIIRWLDFYKLCIAPKVKSRQYAESVKEFLNRRRDSNKKSQHFIGLYTMTHLNKPGLSKKGLMNYKNLAQQVGIEHIHQHAVRCSRIGNGNVKVETVEVEQISDI